MYISYTSDGRYANASVSFRDGSKTHVKHTYLGKVVDKQRGIYKNKERGYFTFDPDTNEYGDVPDDFSIEDDRNPAGENIKSLVFGDVFIMNEFLYKTGMMKVIDDTIRCANMDTLHTLILFYMLSDFSANDAYKWLEGSAVRLFYPNANITGQRISDTLASIGRPEKTFAFQKAYIKFVYETYGDDHGILIDSTGLPNEIHFPMTEYSVHNGEGQNEVRLIFVVQKGTGLPIFYHAVPGNIVDKSTFMVVMEYLDAMSVSIDSIIFDAGYNTSANLDFFYNENHECIISYITRVAANNKELKQMIKEELPTIDDVSNFIKYNDRFLFIKKRKIMVGTNKDCPAWLYLGVDMDRMNNEMRQLFRMAQRKGTSSDEVYYLMHEKGLFALVSGSDYPEDEILPAYYQRQASEQIFDIAKNYTRILPLRCHKVETFKGHLLLSYIASCCMRMFQIQLKSNDLLLGNRLKFMRNQTCMIFKNKIVTEMPQKEENDVYKACGITWPVSIPIINGRLAYSRPNYENQKIKTPKAKSRRDDAVRKKRGRPKGSKNKKTIEKEAELKAKGIKPVKRGRGRPKGSKNKKTIEREKMMAQESKKRGRGRPKGSKNKKTLERERRESMNK